MPYYDCDGISHKIMRQKTKLFMDLDIHFKQKIDNYKNERNSKITT